jgi:hypothetical protein
MFYQTPELGYVLRPGLVSRLAAATFEKLDASSNYQTERGVRISKWGRCIMGVFVGTDPSSYA